MWGRPGKVKEATQPGTVRVEAGAWSPGFLDVVTCCQQKAHKAGTRPLASLPDCLMHLGTGTSVGHWTRPSSLPGCEVSWSSVTWLQGPGGKQLTAQGLF